jgi:hypothetical protein
MKIFVLGTLGFFQIYKVVLKNIVKKIVSTYYKSWCDVFVFARGNYFDIIVIYSVQKKGIEAFIHTFFASIVTIFKKPDIAHYQRWNTS